MYYLNLSNTHKNNIIFVNVFHFYRLPSDQLPTSTSTMMMNQKRPLHWQHQSPSPEAQERPPPPLQAQRAKVIDCGSWLMYFCIESLFYQSLLSAQLHHWHMEPGVHRCGDTHGHAAVLGDQPVDNTVWAVCGTVPTDAVVLVSRPV